MLTVLFVAFGLWFGSLYLGEVGGVRVAVIKMIEPAVLAIWAWRIRQPKGVAKYQGLLLTLGVPLLVVLDFTSIGK